MITFDKIIQNEENKKALQLYGELVIKSFAFKVQGNLFESCKYGIEAALLNRDFKFDEWLENETKHCHTNINPNNHLYFIQAENGAIKIGISKKVKKRLRDLQTASPLKLKIIKIMKGKAHLEGELHKQFHDYNIHGEWFNPAQELLYYINRNSDEKVN
jgi:hypothetical protein